MPQNPPLPVGFPHFPPHPWGGFLGKMVSHARSLRPGFPSRHRTIALLAALRCPKKIFALLACSIFSTAASAVIPAAQLPPSAGQIAVPRPSPRDPPPPPTPTPNPHPQPPPPTPSPRGGGQKQSPRISPGALGLFIFGFSPPARSPPRCALLRQHPPPRSGH